MTVQDNVTAVKLAIAEVKNHCMCAKFEDEGRHYLVIFPPGDWPVDGVRVSHGMGKAKALQLLIDRMEQFWKDSFL